MALRSGLLALGTLGAGATLRLGVARPPAGLLARSVRMCGAAADGKWKPPSGFVDWTDEEAPEIEDALGERGVRKDRRPPTERVFMEAELQAVVGVCAGCGAKFQCGDSTAPGYVPETVLSRSTSGSVDDTPRVQKTPICQRCHGLRYQNQLSAETLRVSPNTTHATLQPDHFLSIWKDLARKRCLIVMVVDLFDFHGSLVPQMGQILGSNNPVIMVANKLDLLPPDVDLQRVERWIKAEARKASLPPLQSLHLVSCKTGLGLPSLVRELREYMTYRRMDAYVVGAANAGKSSFLNYCLKKGPGKEGALTTSHLPGTTLGIVRVSVLAGQYSLYDTPGIFLPTQLTSLLDTTELADVVPKKRVEHVTLRVGEGKTVLLGGLARAELRVGKPFLFTFFLANAVSIHPTSTEKVDEILAKHVGGLLSPPSSFERLVDFAPFVEQVFEVEGRGWDEPAADLVLPGLGWISVTGSGTCTVAVTVPRNVMVTIREPLVTETRTIKGKSYAKFTGSVLKDGRGHTKRRRQG